MRNKVLDDIKKTGYPTELMVASLFEAAGWYCTENEYYIDQDENKGREIDIRANKNATGGRICVWSMLSVEVKKSDKPWIIFTSNKRFLEPGGYGLLNHCHNVNSDLLTYENIMDEHPSCSQLRLGRKEYVAFSSTPQIFSAILSATKAGIEAHRLAEAYKEAYNADSYDVSFYTPLVVVNGNLFEAYLDDQGEMCVEEKNHIAFRLNYASPSYDKSRYLVDIVTTAGLGAYLDLQNRWIKHMHTCISNKL